jgi:ABC-type multidrug transport system permease subunit
MNAAPPKPTWPRTASILWFPIFFAIVLPITFETAFHNPRPHNVAIAAVGTPSQVSALTAALHRVSPNGFDVRTLPSPAAAGAAVRSRAVAAAYVAGSPSDLYLAPAASAIGANNILGIFTTMALKAGTPPPRSVDLVPLASGDGGNGTFFFVFSLMMIGLITVIVLLQLPTWRIGPRMVVVAAVGALGSLVAYLTVIHLHALPGKPLLLLYGFLLTQVYGQLMVGAQPLLKQYFLPVSITLALVLSVPSSGGTVPPYLLPALFHDLSHVLPLAQAVKVTRSVAYFHNNGIAQATLVLALWAAIAAAVLAVAWMRQPRVRPASGESTADTNTAIRTTQAAT